jgi:hypothetical protein
LAVVNSSLRVPSMSIRSASSKRSTASAPRAALYACTVTWGAVAGLASVLPWARRMGELVGVEAGLVLGLARAGGALDGAEGVAPEGLLPRVGGAMARCAKSRASVSAVEVHQRPGVLGEQVGVVEVVVKLQDVELVLVLLHLARERLRREEDLPVQLPRRARHAVLP